MARQARAAGRGRQATASIGLVWGSKGLVIQLLLGQKNRSMTKCYLRTIRRSEDSMKCELVDFLGDLGCPILTHSQVRANGPRPQCVSLRLRAAMNPWCCQFGKMFRCLRARTTEGLEDFIKDMYYRIL